MINHPHFEEFMEEVNGTAKVLCEALNDVPLGVGIPAAAVLCISLSRLAVEHKMFASFDDAIEQFKRGIDELSAVIEIEKKGESNARH